MIAMRGQEPGFVLIKFLYETPVKSYSTYAWKYCKIFVILCNKLRR